MKTKILNLAAMLLILAGVVSSCEKEKEESIEIPFTEYSLAETNCQWTNLDYDNSVIVINSKTELENYISCTEETFPEIDFSKYTLVLASGVSSSNVGSIHTALFKYSDTEYELNITVYRGLLAIMEPWCVSIITSKIPDTVKINLKPDYVTL